VVPTSWKKSKGRGLRHHVLNRGSAFEQTGQP